MDSTQSVYAFWGRALFRCRDFYADAFLKHPISVRRHHSPQADLRETKEAQGTAVPSIGDNSGRLGLYIYGIICLVVFEVRPSLVILKQACNSLSR